MAMGAVSEGASRVDSRAGRLGSGLPGAAGVAARAQGSAA
jgi:hypothetical protein